MTPTPDPEGQAREVLDRLGVPYELIPIDPAFADTAAFCERYGYPPVKASFASAEEMAQLTGMTMGGVTVFGLPDALPIFVDERVMGLDYVILGTGGRSGKIKVAPEVFRRLPRVRAIPGLALER